MDGGGACVQTSFYHSRPSGLRSGSWLCPASCFSRSQVLPGYFWELDLSLCVGCFLEKGGGLPSSWGSCSHSHGWASCQRVQPLVFASPPVSLRQPSVFSVLLNSCQSPSAPQRSPTPRPRLCRARRFPRTRALCLQPWEGPGPPRLLLGSAGDRGVLVAASASRALPRRRTAAPGLQPDRTGLRPRAAPALGRAALGSAATSAAEGRALRAACCAARTRGPPRNPRHGPGTRGERDANGPAASGVSERPPPCPFRRRRPGSGGCGAGRSCAVQAEGGGEGLSLARCWGVRISGLSRGGSLRRDAPKPVPRSHGAGRPGRGADGAARAAAGPIGAAAGGGGLGPGSLRRVGAAAAARLPPRAAAPAGALCRRECQAGGARIVVAARSSWEDSGPGLWGRCWLPTGAASAPLWATS